MLQVKVKDVIKIPMSLFISHDQGNHITYYSTVRNHMIKLTMLRIHLERSSNE